jgi:uncharacterized protein involved in exopolysaccharide biosynthesis
MSLSTIVSIVLRRWPFVLLALVLGFGGGAVAFLSTPRLYEARTELLMLPPTQESVGRNPYLALSSSLSQTGAIVAAQVSSPATVERLQAAGAVLVAVTRNPDFDAPVIEVLAQGNRPEAADAAVSELTRDFNSQLAAIQQAAEAPAASYIETSVITRTPQPERVLKKAVRNGIVGWGLITVLGLGGILLLERRSHGDSGEGEAGRRPSSHRRRVGRRAASPAADAEASEDLGPPARALPEDPRGLVPVGDPGRDGNRGDRGGAALKSDTDSSDG